MIFVVCIGFGMEDEMEFNEVLETRRSIRRYKMDKVEKDLIERMLRAATLAPSWKNSETARYYVVMSEEMLEKVKNECLPSFNAARVKEAPVLIVTTFVKDISGFGAEGVPANEAGNGWGYYDLGLHNENLILEARNLGLDTLIMGLRHEEKLRNILQIPEEELVVSVISVGYRDIDPEMPKRRELLEITKFY